MRTAHVSTSTPHAAAGAAMRRVGANAGVVADLRSYLHAGEMAGWCRKILLRGPAGAAYNVGSDEEITISALAQRVAAVVVRGTPRQGVLASRYASGIELAAAELGVRPLAGLGEAPRCAAARHRSALAPLNTQRRPSP